MRLAVGIATRGRPRLVREVLLDLARQRRKPDRVVVAHVGPEDIDAPIAGVEYLVVEPGLTVQRNAILDAVGDCDIIVFFDDDFFCAPEYLAITERIFEREADCVVTTGRVVADGVNGAGYTISQAHAVLRRYLVQESAASLMRVEQAFNGYGCNMALRLAPLREHGIRFDENLPLYGWYEDLDATRALGRYGKILKLNGARGVHLGVKAGRLPGIRLGYSQVANSIYLARKGTYPWTRALPSMLRHTVKNFFMAAAPEPWVDRWGRFRGNALALGDWARGKVDPRRILEL
jgi:glycosyltransferase involved in cell wall biosynthesis